MMSRYLWEMIICMMLSCLLEVVYCTILCIYIFFMIFMSWNSRGAGGAPFHRFLGELCRNKCVNLLALLEPRQPGSRARNVARKLGWPNMHIVEARGFSGGIWLFWDDETKFSVLTTGDQFIHGVIDVGTGNEFFVTLVYGHPNMILRRSLWSSLNSICNPEEDRWMIMGDFNAVTCPEDRNNSSQSSGGVDVSFRNWVLSNDLVDIGFSGPRFTWGRGSSQSRIDRVFVTSKWYEFFSDAHIVHLPKYKSDHSPIILDTSILKNYEKVYKPFRFFAPWVLHEDFPNFVQNNWKINDSWNSSVSLFTKKLSAWNRKTFGHIQRSKERILRQLDVLNDTISRMGCSSSLELTQRELWSEFEKILIREEVMWMQYSRTKWYNEGDRNSKYFHVIANGRRRRNKILSLKLESGEWSYDPDEIMEMGRRFFENLYTSSEVYNGSLVYGCTYPRIDENSLSMLGRGVNEVEVKKALFDMGPLKAPGPDGLNPLFYQSQWETVGGSVVKLVLSMFEKPDLIEHINGTRIVLIPKVAIPQTIQDLRPISLCNVIYKIVTKIISNRLKPIISRVVAPNQCSFIKGRQSSDNIILVQEIIHSMRNMRKKNGFMAIKIDLEKAYDRIQWNFIFDCLRELEIPENIQKVIQKCVSTPLMNILWNGADAGSFKPTRGVRQGDPLSPYLFVLAMEKLGHLIQTAVNDKDWQPFQISKKGIAISHLFFADDLILFAKADMEQAGVVKAILDDFCEVSGQRVNASKSRIFFSKNVNHIRSKEICDFLEFTPTSNLGKYLGMPIIHDKVSSSTYNFVLEKMETRLSNWKVNMLSFAARQTLVSSVLSAMPSYAMQTVPLPSGMCDRIDKCCRNFLWGNSSSGRKIHAISWERVCSGKEFGGLGIRKAKYQNKAYMSKLGWALISRRDSLWVQFLREKYKGGADLIPEVKKRRVESSTWKGIRCNWNTVKEGIAWRVVNGREISFWEDSWVPHLGKLSALTLLAIPEDIKNWKVADVLSPSGTWDWQKFRNYFVQDVLKAIERVSLRSSECQDFPVWRWTSDGVFTIKSVYEQLKKPSNATISRDWKVAWSLKVPQRYRTFLWLCLHDRVLTNELRLERKISATSACDICKDSEETLIHALRDCCGSDQVWRKVLPQFIAVQFFNFTNVYEWLNWSMRQRILIQGFEFRLWFAIICRNLWLRRNEFVFNNNLWGEYNVIARSYACLGWGRPVLNQELKENNLDRWECPAYGYLKFNIDGARNLSSGYCTCGGVLRDHNGDFIQAFQYRIGIGSSLSAEAWGFLWALKLSWEKKVQSLIVESDCHELVNILQKTIPVCHPDFEVLQEIKSFLRKKWTVILKICPRDANCVADMLAGVAQDMNVDFFVYVDPPDLIHSLLVFDLSLLSYCRNSVIVAE